MDIFSGISSKQMSMSKAQDDVELKRDKLTAAYAVWNAAITSTYDALNKVLD